MICKTDKCVGCNNCVQVCPVKAISMKMDEYGFYTTHVNEKKCLKCGKCAKVCPGLDEYLEFKKVPCYAAYTKNEEVLKNSTSGGLFSVFAEEILCRGGIVFGAVQDLQSCYVYHTAAKSIEELRAMRGSKYVQSDLKKTIAETIEYLKDGRFVLFSGTPCQISALNKRIKIANVDISKLFTVDVVCHGTPNYKFLRDYINLHENKVGKCVNRLIFRCKENGWNFDKMYVNYVSDKKLTELGENYYHAYFGWGYLFRDSCYSCSKAGSKRVSDVTIGDFWNIQHYIGKDYLPNMDAGTSMVLINSPQGEMLFSSVKNKIYCCPVDVEIARKENHQLVHPTSVNQTRRKLIFTCYRFFGAKGVDILYNIEKRILSFLK